MTKRRVRYASLTDALRTAIMQSDLSFNELQRQTGVLRQSLMKFARGETSLRLDVADKLAEYFEIEITRCNARAKTARMDKDSERK
jgi:predicted transcriptional regulator